MLIGVALGASAIVFSAADSFVFQRVPYPGVGRLMVLQRTTSMIGATDYISPELLPEWRKQTDLFSAIHAHDRGVSVYLTTRDVTEAVRCQLVTPGLLDALGVAPRWDRLIQPGDEQPDRAPVVVIGEELARRLFGDPPAR